MIDTVTVPAAPIIPLLIQQLAPIFTALALLVTAGLSGYAAILSARNGRKADRIERSITDNAGTINDHIAEVHRATNGITDRLVKTTGDAERAKGVLEGRQLQKDEMPPPTAVLLPIMLPGDLPTKPPDDPKPA